LWSLFTAGLNFSIYCKRSRFGREIIARNIPHDFGQQSIPAKVSLSFLKLYGVEAAEFMGDQNANIKFNSASTADPNEMAILTPNGSHVGLHKLIAFSTMLSPTHHTTHLRPLVQAGGGESQSLVPPQQLYLCHAILDFLQKVYDTLREAEPTLSRSKLETWLTTVQSQVVESLDKEDYKFEEFLQAVYYNRGLEAIKEAQKEKDLSKPLSNYYISSSHNTFLSGNQLASKSTTGAYKNVRYILFFCKYADYVGLVAWLSMCRN
jgi:hypothetical protein